MTNTDADSTFTYEGQGGVPLAARRWDPAGEPLGVVQLVHGMGEHIQRYGAVARSLTDAGFVVYGHDHRGHGASARSSADLGQLGPGGWPELVADIHVLTSLIHDRHPDLRVALVAHSMGSFAAQQYLPEHSADVDAVVLTGTTALDELEASFDLDKPMELAALNAPFAPARTAFDWLSRDESIVDAYLGDPLCGAGLDVDAAREMFAGARQLVERNLLERIRADLPIYLVVGEQDPINGQGALAHLLAKRLRDAGVHDVTVRVYPGARHEVLNETNRDEVVADIVPWLRKKAHGGAEDV
jgi:alpha-beta hydrolase superfamily lysophospholipase